MADMKSRVTVHSKLTVVSDTPIKPGKTYPLSVLDHAMGLHSLHLIFYYRHGGQSESSNWGSFDLSRLRVSLSEILSHYPPVTGRLRRGEQGGNWEVKCNDAGVRVLKAKVNVTLDEWLRSADGSEERELTVWEGMPEPDEMSTWSPFLIQINNFEGGGLAIGLSCPHMHADPTCATIFMKSWTEIYRRDAIAHPPFFHPPALCGRTNPNTNTNTTKYYEAKSKAKPTNSPLKMSTATFKFLEIMIKKSVSEVQTKYPDATPFDMLAALFWSSVMRAKTHATHEPCNLTLCIDFRKLMHIPLPHGFFGNALHFSSISTDAAEMNEGGLDYAVGLIHQHLKAMDEEEYWSSVDWFESQKDEEGKFAQPFNMYGPELTCANMEHLSAYAAVIEDMKPVHVAYHVGNVEGEGLVLVLPSPEGGLGRTVMVTLPEDQISRLCDDPAILRLEPTMLVSGGR